MSKKIYGNMVSTPLCPDKITPPGIVTSVDGILPDENGNVAVNIPGAVNEALTQAKESGVFKGDPGEPGPKGDPGERGESGPRGVTGEAGKTPVKGVDYFTPEDIEEFKRSFDGVIDTISASVTTMGSRVDATNARLDNLSSLGEGSTTGDAELIDIRTGADGTIYANAGAAVREQYSKLKNGKLDIGYNISQSIQEGTDLDNILTPGKYAVVSVDRVKSLLNMPASTMPGALFVFQSYSTSRLFQMYIDSRGLTFLRTYYDGSWLTWKRFLTEEQKGNLGVTTYDGLKMLSSVSECATSFNVLRDITTWDDEGNTVVWKAAGETASGVPYYGASYYGRDAFFNFSLESIFSMFNNPDSLMYTFSGYPDAKLYTGGVCSSFVAWVCGLPVYYTTYDIRKMLNYKTIRDLSDLEIGDVLICHTSDGSTGDHVSVVSNIYVNETGVTSIDISESASPCFRTVNMSAKKVWGLFDGTTRKGDFYRVGRFDNHKIRTIPPLVINTDIISERGDNTYYELGEDIYVQSLESAFNVECRDWNDDSVKYKRVVMFQDKPLKEGTNMRNISDVLNTVGRWTLYGSNGEESHITIIKKGSAVLDDGVVTLSGYEGCKPSGFTVVGVSTTSNGGYEPYLEEYNGQPCYAGRVTIKSKDDPRYAGEITEDEFYINLTEVPDRYFAVYVRVFYDTGCGLAFQDTNVIYLDELTEREPEEDELETRLQSLEDAVADLLYDEIDITSFTITPSVAEMGATVKSVNLKWEINKDPVTQSVDLISLPVDVREITLNPWLTEDYTFNCQARDERGSVDSEDKTLSFYNGVYYGVLADGAEVDSAAILTLTRKLQNSKSVTFTATADATQRFAYAIPTRYGTPTFKDADTTFGADFTKLPEPVRFTNNSGFTENYDVWLSTYIIPKTKTFSVS